MAKYEAAFRAKQGSECQVGEQDEAQEPEQRSKVLEQVSY